MISRNRHWPARSSAIAIVASAMVAMMPDGAVSATTASIETTGAPDRAAIEFYNERLMTMISGYTPEGGDRQQERAFSGMTITSGLTPRGGDDLHGRLLARHMGRHIPGRPRFIVQTWPGAGGRRAANYLLHHAPQEGSVIGNLPLGLPLEPLQQPRRADQRADPTGFHWLGSLRGETGFVIAWTASGEVTTDQLFSRDLLVGGTAFRDDSVVLARALNALIGTRFKIISGYSGTLDMQIAMERGEIAGFLAGSSDIKSRLIPWTQTGQARALLQLGQQPDPEFPAVPMALEFAATAADRETLQFIFARQALGAPYVAPPGVPDNRLAALRQAFNATMADGDFLADALRLDIALRPLSGDTLGDMLAQLATVSAATRKRATEIIGPLTSSPGRAPR